MRYILFFFGLIICTTSFSQNKNVTAAKHVAERVVPSLADKIVFQQIDRSPDGKDVYEIETKNNQLIVKGNNANSMCVGLNDYLRNYCHVAVSWYRHDSLQVPKTLASVASPVRREANVSKRFFLNYCTFGYTMPWWQWKDWEWFIDWMSLNGINMPLAITGEEAVWQNVWRKFGLNDDEIRSYFTGPAYLPWHRMANIDKWEGPLPQSWIDSQLNLQKKIVARERELNMTPVLPAFAGHVPQAIQQKFPHAKITSLGEWGDFDKAYQSYFLDPFDSLFSPIQQAFLKEQTKLFGTDHVYGTDPFNEVTPPSWEPGYLASVSKSIYNSMASVDKDAEWVQMGWIFYNNRAKWTDERIKAFITAIPQGKMILLDYFCENTEIWKFTKSFYGQPFIWCYLGNFGGNTMMEGDMKDVENKLNNTFENGGNNFTGIGSTLEGFGVNPVVYEFLFDKTWNDGKINVSDWISNWGQARYGMNDDNVSQAWKILLNTAYAHIDGIGRATLTNARPCFYGHSSWTTNDTIMYSNKDLLKAWELLLKAGKQRNDTYLFDITNVGRQVMGNYFAVLRDDFTKAYNEKNLAAMQEKGAQMLGLMNDMDTLLATNKSCLLGTWIADARALGTTGKEKQYYESDAKRIITTWDEKGRGLNEYANRALAGLMKTYYLERWKLFINESIDAVKNNQSLDEKKFLKDVIDLEESWVENHLHFSANTVGDCFSENKKLYQKYAGQIERHE